MCHDRLNEVGLRNQRQEQGCAAGRIERFGIGLAKFVVRRVPVISAGYTYDWSVVSGQLVALSIKIAAEMEALRRSCVIRNVRIAVR